MAVPVLNGKTQFLDAAGVSLALGTVSLYVPGTTTPKQTWQDQGKTILNTTPTINLDAGGYAMIYGAGAYRQVVKDAMGTTIWDQVAWANDAEGDLADASGSSLVGYQAHGTTVATQTVQDRLRRTVELDDYFVTGDSDYSAAMSRAIAEINTGTIGKLVLPAKAYTIASGSIGGTYTITRNGVEIDARGATVTISGSTLVTSLFTFLNCSGRIRGGTWIGNASGTGYTNGSAVQFLLTSAATAGISIIEVTGATFQNFKSPYWVYVYNSCPAANNYAIKTIRITDNSFVSVSGNQIDVSNLGQRTSFICIESTASVSDGAGGCYDVKVTGNSGDGSYVRSGVFLSGKVIRARVLDNDFVNCGQSGANDNCGAYAFAAYDSAQLGMANVEFIANSVNNVRSVGIYTAGHIPGLRIKDFNCYTQTDTVDASLPKGAVCLNGPTDFIVEGVDCKDIASDGVFFTPDTAIVRGVIRNVSGVNCKNVVNLVSNFADTDGLEVYGITGHEFTANGIAINLVDGAWTAKNWHISDFDLSSTVTGSIGVRLFSGGAGKFFNITIGGASRVKAETYGVDVNSMGSSTSGVMRISGISFDGPFSGAGLRANSAVGVDIDDLSFANQDTTGYCFRVSGTQGSLGASIRYNGVSAGYVFAISGVDFGNNAPTWTAVAGAKVWKLQPGALDYAFWVNTDGGTTWKRGGQIEA